MMEQSLDTLDAEKDYYSINSLRDAISDELEIDIDISFDGLTYEIDSDEFRLALNIEDDYLTILNIKVINEERGIGRKIVEIIHEFADENNLEKRATKVKDEAVEFWKKMGYQQGSTDGEYFYIG